jgi:hypothetical protein
MTKKALAQWAAPRGNARDELWGMEHTRITLEDVFGEDLHLARVRSLSNGVSGMLNARTASVAAIGRAYAKARGIETKSGIKQIDRLLSNDGIRMEEVLPLWVKHVVGATPEVFVAIDWTDFDDDDHTTLCVSLITTHGRATPLAWRTVKKSKLKNRRTRYELEMVERVYDFMPRSTHVTWLGDRAFGYGQLREAISRRGHDYILRFRENVMIQDGDDNTLLAASKYVPENGRVRMLVDPKLTHEREPAPAVVLVKRKGMKEAWCLVTSLKDARAGDIVEAYSRRFTIEETFRDTKDLTFGMGLRATHIRDEERRDRMLLLIAIAQTLLTLLGVASEASGLDRTLKANTVKRRTMSLLNQGLYWYDCLATMRDEWFERLMTAYETTLQEHQDLAQILLFNTPLAVEK